MGWLPDVTGHGHSYFRVSLPILNRGLKGDLHSQADILLLYLFIILVAKSNNKSVNMMTTNLLKTVVEPSPETSFIHYK
jgi:hypothetical protein